MADNCNDLGRKLPVWTKLGYSFGSLASAMMANGLGFYVLMFYTDIVGLNAALVGVAQSVGRFWDAVTDPAMGHISDRTRSRFGRRRPYIILGAPLLAVAFVLPWCAPLGRSVQITFAYVVFVNVFITTMQTVVGIPYGALGAELTMDYHERNSVMAYGQGASMIGYVIGSGLIGFASVAGGWLDPELHVGGLRGAVEAFVSATSYKCMNGGGFRVAALVLAPLVVVCYLVATFATRENPSFQRRSSTPAMRSLISPLKNRPFQIYMVMFLIETTVGQIGGFMLPFIVIHWLRKPGYLMPAFVALTCSTLAGLWLWRLLGQRLEKKDCFIASLAAGFVVSPLFFVIVSPERPFGFLIWATLGGLVIGGRLIYAPSMMADIIDTDELECGLRREGAFIGINNFIMKCAGSLGALWVGPGLALAGYDGLAAVQSDRTLLIMRLMYVCPGILINIVLMLIISRFPLTSKVMAEVRRSINARRELQAEGHHVVDEKRGILPG
jgi:GPH family glycoside/pentoside/hexuronide:cation symporter